MQLSNFFINHEITSLTVEFMIESHKVCLEWKVKVVLADTSFKIKYNEKCE